MKKVTVLLIALMVSICGFAQFEKGKMYAGASLSGLNICYNGADKGSFALQAKGGYMIKENIMATGQVEYNDQDDADAYISLGVGGRYYMVQNGIYLGATVNLIHAGDAYNDFRPGVQVGYAYFLNKNVVIEPELYYDQSFKSHSDYSTIGVRVGIGIYL